MTGIEGLGGCPFHNRHQANETPLPQQKGTGQFGAESGGSSAAATNSEFDHFMNQMRSGDPYPAYRMLRERGDVVPLSQGSRPGNVVVVLGYNAAKKVLVDNEAFISTRASHGQSEPQQQTSKPVQRAQSSLQKMADDWVVHRDDGVHGTLRQLFGAPLEPASVKDQSPRLKGLCGEVLSASTKNGGEICLVKEIARTFPLRVLLDQYNWKDLENVLSIDDVTKIAYGTASSAITYDARKAARNVLAEKYPEFESFLELAAGAKLVAKGEALGISKDMVAANVMFYLIAGHETTSSLIGTIVQLCIEQPELWQELKSDNSLVTPFVNEALRYEPPVQLTSRTVTREIDLEGQRLSSGDLVLVSIGAANRDPKQFGDEPDEFRLWRKKGPGISFGAGPHSCHGMHLAMEEAKVFVNASLECIERFEGVADSPAERSRDATFRGFSRFPVRVIPRCPEAN